MVEISNIDAIIELILKEAREQKHFQLATRAFIVLGEIGSRLGEILNTFEVEERRKKKDENKH